MIFRFQDITIWNSSFSIWYIEKILFHLNSETAYLDHSTFLIVFISHILVPMPGPMSPFLSPSVKILYNGGNRGKQRQLLLSSSAVVKLRVELKDLCVPLEGVFFTSKWIRLFCYFCIEYPGENFSQNFSYNFSEFLYNFRTFSHFFIRTHIYSYELEHFSEILHLFSKCFIYVN